MNKTRKTKLYVLLIALVCLLALCLCACSGGADGANGTNGTNGQDGANGKSAYEIWLDEGHTGSQTDFLNWLKGADGKDGSNGQDGTNGDNGTDGKSAYQIWIDNGHSGTEAEFLEWLKGQDGTQGSKGETGAAGSDGQEGTNGLSAYEIFLKYYPYYTGTEEQWINSVAKGDLKIHKITFKSEASDDIYRFVFEGYALADIPEVPEKEGQTSAAWSITDFSSITQDTEVTAVYDMRKYVTFHNEYTDDEDIVKTVEYGEAVTDIPQITAKVGNDSKWSVTDFNEIKTDLLVEAVYETQGLQYTLINRQTQYRVSKGEMNAQIMELFIPKELNSKPVTVIDTNAFSSCDFKLAHIPNSVVEIRDSAFNYCSNLTSVTIPNSVTTIGNQAFGYCRSVTSVIIPDSVTTIGDWAFCNCNITTIEIPNSVTSIGSYAFSCCSGLTSITIPSSVTTIGSGVFLECIELTNIAVQSGNEKYHSNGDCLIETKLKILILGCINSIIPDDGSVTSIDDNAFYHCNLTSIKIPNSVTSIGSNAFTGCSSLTSIEIPNSVTYIGSYAFMYCDNIMNATLPTSAISKIPVHNLQTVVITNGESIESVAFLGCDSLTSIEIPNSVTSIGSNAFYGCSELETIYYKGAQSEFNNISIHSDGNTSFTDAMVYYYSEMPPTDGGYYWHYDTDNKTPVVWAKQN